MEVDPLNTPMKKIQALCIHSPDIKQIMVEKGYSNSISDKVLNELNLKLNDISNLPQAPDHVMFDDIHNSHFNKMESIMNHYSIKRNTSEIYNTKKKRRTLTGIEESPVPMAQDRDKQSSPIRQRSSLSPNKPFKFFHSQRTDKRANRTNRTVSPNRLSPDKFNGPRLSPDKLSGPKLSPDRMSNNFNTRLSPEFSSLSPDKIRSSPNKLNTSNNVPSSISSPGMSSTATPTVSPTKATGVTGISPSKGSLNLNGLLGRKIPVPKPQNDFKLPKSFTKIEQERTPTLQKKSSIPTLQKKSSIPTLQKKSSVSTLNPSIHSLQHKSSIPALQHKSSIPTLQHKSSIPTLQKRPSTSSLSSNPRPLPSLSSKPTSHTLSKKSSIPTFQRTSSQSNSLSSAPAFNYVSNPSFHSNPTTSSSTSYAKPTISSSQKSLDRFNIFNKFH